MKTLNQHTKKAQAFIKRYWEANETRICECYKTYSDEKRSAEIRCLEKMVNENGHRYRIISYNTFGFSAAWLVNQSLHVLTPRNEYLIPNIIANVR